MGMSEVVERSEFGVDFLHLGSDVLNIRQHCIFVAFVDKPLLLRRVGLAYHQIYLQNTRKFLLSPAIDH